MRILLVSFLLVTSNAVAQDAQEIFNKIFNSFYSEEPHHIKMQVAYDLDVENKTNKIEEAELFSIVSQDFQFSEIEGVRIIAEDDITVQVGEEDNFLIVSEGSESAFAAMASQVKELLKKPTLKSTIRSASDTTTTISITDKSGEHVVLKVIYHTKSFRPLYYESYGVATDMENYAMVLSCTKITYTYKKILEKDMRPDWRLAHYVVKEGEKYKATDKYKYYNFHYQQ